MAAGWLFFDPDLAILERRLSKPLMLRSWPAKTSKAAMAEAGRSVIRHEMTIATPISMYDQKYSRPAIPRPSSVAEQNLFLGDQPSVS